MKAEDKQLKNRKWVGNCIDIVVGILLLTAIFTIGYRVYENRKLALQNEEASATVSFTVEKADAALCAHCAAEETVYIADSGSVFGTLLENTVSKQAFLSTPHLFRVSAENGEEVQGTFEDSPYVDLSGACLCSGCVTENGIFYLHGTMPLIPGESVTVYTEETIFTLRIDRVTVGMVD